MDQRTGSKPPKLSINNMKKVTTDNTKKIVTKSFQLSFTQTWSLTYKKQLVNIFQEDMYVQSATVSHPQQNKHSVYQGKLLWPGLLKIFMHYFPILNRSDPHPPYAGDNKIFIHLSKSETANP